MKHAVKIPSPEETGIYKCQKCGNDTEFTGHDAHGSAGPDECECDEDPCVCEALLTQDFDVSNPGQQDQDIWYEAFEGGGVGSEIGSYTKIICRKCKHVIWSEHQCL